MRRRLGALILLLLVLAQPSDAEPTPADGALPALALPALEGAQVTLPWSEMRPLLDAALRAESQRAGLAVAPSAPLPFVVSDAHFTGVVHEAHTELDARFTVEVLAQDWIAVPLLRSEPALVAAATDGGSARIVVVDGAYQLLVREPGTTQVTLRMHLPIGVDSPASGFELGITPATRTTLSLDLRRADLVVQVTPRASGSVRLVDGATRVDAVLPQTERLRVDWTEALPAPELDAVAALPRIAVAQLVSVGGGILKLDAALLLSVRGGTVDRIAFRLPADTSVLAVGGSAVREHRVVQDDASHVVTVFFAKPIGDQERITIRAERSMADTTAIVTVPQLQVLGVERESGYIGVTATTSVEIAATTTQGLTGIDVRELPAELWQAAPHPLLLAYKYIQQPYQLVLDVQRHDDLPVLSSTIDGAWVTTFHTEDGKLLHSVVLATRNTHKQFLRVTLPERAQILSAFVSDHPVKPATNDQGHVLIPLDKSAIGDRQQRAFPVELVVLEQARSYAWLGARSTAGLQVDIPISVLHWSLVLPEPYRYFGIGGDLHAKVDDGGSGAAAFLATSRAQAPGPSSQARTGSQDVLADAGVLPVRIHIPDNGRRLSFRKELVMVDDPPPRITYRYLAASFTAALRFLITVLGIGAAAFAGLVLLQLRARADVTARLGRLRRGIALLVAAVAWDGYLFGPSVASIAAVLIAAVITIDAHLTSRREATSVEPAP